MPTVLSGSDRYTAINSSRLFLNGGLRGQWLQSVLDFNITNLHPMSDWSHYFPHCCTVNICEPTVYFTAWLFSAVAWVGLPNFLIFTVMLDTQSLNTSLLEVMIPSKMNAYLFAIWVTLLCNTSSMLGGRQSILAWSGWFLAIVQDMCLCGDSICTAGLRRQAALASYVSFVIKFFAIHQTMGPAEWGNTCCVKAYVPVWPRRKVYQ
jgi:hypothetical protein